MKARKYSIAKWLTNVIKRFSRERLMPRSPRYSDYLATQEAREARERVKNMQDQYRFGRWL